MVWTMDGGPATELSEDDVAGGILAERLAAELSARRVDLLRVVERLGPTLTSADASARARGARLLADALSALAPDALSAPQLAFVAAFFAERARDAHHFAPPILDAARALLRMDHLPRGAAAALLRAIFEHVPCQQQTRADRLKTYELLHEALTARADEVKSIETDFVLGLILSMDGERDPRNLMYLFSVLPSFLESLNLGHATEEMFEVMACYFPVDFNTPPDEANAITRDDLAEKLSACLCAVPAFADHCIPLLLEKLDSNLKPAKMDSLKLLRQSCGTFSSISFKTHLHPIWQALQKEITQESDAEIKILALDALSDLVNNLCNYSEDLTISKSFLEQILITMQSLLIDAKIKSRFETPLHTFLSVARASEKSAAFIAKNATSHLVAYFRTIQEDPLKIVLLEYFASLFAICKRWKVLGEVTDEFKFLVEIVLMTNNSSNIDLKVAGYEALHKMSDLVSANEAVMFQDMLNYNINNETIERVVDSSKMCLISLARRHPSCYERFVDELLILEEIGSNHVLLNKRIDSLISLASLDHFTDKIIVSVLIFIKKIDIKTSGVVLKSIVDNFRSVNLYKEEKFQEIEKNHNLISDLIDWTMENDLYLVEDLSDVVCDVIVIVIEAQSPTVQNELISQTISKYGTKFFDKDEAMVILEALLNSSKEDVHIENVDVILRKAYDIAVGKKSSIRTKSCILIANILNKYISDQQVQAEYAVIKEKLSNVDQNDPEGHGVVLLSWIAKAFLHNGHVEAVYWLSKLVDLIHSEQYGSCAAKGIALIMSDCDRALNKKCHCKTNFLYKQKVFQMFLQLNADAVKYHRALLESWCYILQTIPKSVLIMELSKVSNVIVESLNLENTEVLLVILEIFSYLIQNNKSVCTLQTLLPRCLELCARKYPVKVRAASLQCVFDVASHCATHQLLPHKQDTILELANFLDDPKRLVRSVAVKARTRWFMVGSPGEEKET